MRAPFFTLVARNPSSRKAPTTPSRCARHPSSEGVGKATSRWQPLVSASITGCAKRNPESRSRGSKSPWIPGSALMGSPGLTKVVRPRSLLRATATPSLGQEGRAPPRHASRASPTRAGGDCFRPLSASSVARVSCLQSLRSSRSGRHRIRAQPFPDIQRDAQRLLDAVSQHGVVAHLAAGPRLAACRTGATWRAGVAARAPSGAARCATSLPAG